VAGGDLVDVAPGRTGLDDRDSVLGVNNHTAHEGEVDDDTAIGRGVPCNAVSATTHRDLGFRADGVADGGDDVRAAAAAEQNARPLVDQAVEDLPRRVVVGAVGIDHVARKSGNRVDRSCHRCLRISRMVACFRR
jgi:hypothetical protein